MRSYIEVGNDGVINRIMNVSANLAKWHIGIEKSGHWVLEENDLAFVAKSLDDTWV